MLDVSWIIRRVPSCKASTPCVPCLYLFCLLSAIHVFRDCSFVLSADSRILSGPGRCIYRLSYPICANVTEYSVHATCPRFLLAVLLPCLPHRWTPSRSVFHLPVRSCGRFAGTFFHKILRLAWAFRRASFLNDANASVGHLERTAALMR